MKNKNFSKFEKRSTASRRNKEAAKRELLRALAEVGVDARSAKLGVSEDRGRSGRVSQKVHSDEEVVCGVYSSTQGGFGFVRREGARDIFIPRGAALGAIDGDVVEAIFHLYYDRNGEERTEGRVKRIVEYGRRTVIGRLDVERVRHKYLRYYIDPDDRHLNIKPVVEELCGAHRGDKVEATIRRDAYSRPSANIVRVFGKSDSKEANYEAILADCEIGVEFSPEELSEADRVAGEALSREGRVDLRDEIIFTIDGAGAKDLDDAISLIRISDGYRLGVHIADVSHYVRERTALDRAVMSRGTSVYFTDKVVPMLPPVLSNGACSLNAGEDKYTLSAIIELDGEGNIKDTKIEKTIINSRVRGVYSEVNELLSGDGCDEIREKYDIVAPSLYMMRELYLKLLSKSRARGAIDFDADEAVVILDAHGNPTDVVRRERGVSERIIEQFMLTANEAVASYLYEREIPCVYRVHEAPPPDKLKDFLIYAQNIGLDTRAINRDAPDSLGFSRLLSSADEKGLSLSVSYTMLRTMAKAKYSDTREGHFGLGIKNYCHFTSPIRRLSDLATHRIIKGVLMDGKRKENYKGYARRAAAAATEGELRAFSAERRIENLYKVIYMSAFLGHSFSATVKSVTPFGLFVELDNTVEGLIPLDEMMGKFTFDERTLTLRSARKSYHLSDRLVVILEDADVERGELRFSISEGY